MRTVASIAMWVVLGCASSPQRSGLRSAEPTSILEGSTISQHSGRSQDVAVRHRRTPISWNDIVVVARGGPSIAAAPPPPVAQPLAAPADASKLVVEAWIEMQADDVAQLAVQVRAQVEAAGGRVVSENVISTERTATSAAFELRLPPIQQGAFVGWLASRGDIESKRILASDVGKKLFDQELAIANLELTMKRLQELAARDVPMQALLEIEKEMTRVRGELETVRGQQRWLLDRVAMATITLTIQREGGAIDLSPDGRVFPGPRLAMLSLLDAGDRPRNRVGGGFAFHVERFLTFELDVFPQQDGDSRTVLATIGSALYSGFLGHGRRRFGNPYIGARAGYGYLSGKGGMALAAELGVELVRHRMLLVEASARVLVFAHEPETDVALHGALAVMVPF